MFKKKIYLKDLSRDPFYNSVNKSFVFKTRAISAGLLALGGFVLITQVAMPLVFFTTQDNIDDKTSGTVLGTATGFSKFEFDELKNEAGSDSDGQANVPKYFYISIPKLKIVNSVVETNSTNLSPDTALGHYMGSSLPGENGNAFIFGHSVLPIFYNPRNYKTIFSTLEKLATGDTIEINYNNEKLTYKVESKEILSPDKVNPLETFKPKYLNESTIELMTCWPSGSKAKRLVVKAVKE